MKRVERQEAIKILLEKEYDRLLILSKETLVETLLSYEEDHLDTLNDTVLSNRLLIMTDGEFAVTRKDVPEDRDGI